MASTIGGGLDVDWLLHSRKDHAQPPSDQKPVSQILTQPQIQQTEPTPPPSPANPALAKQSQREPHTTASQQKPISAVTGKEFDLQAAAQKIVGSTPPKSPQNQQSRPSLSRGQNSDETKRGLKPNGGNVRKEGRRSSWIASFSSKFSSSNSPPPSHNSSFDVQSQSNGIAASPQPIPRHELTNPFNKKELVKDVQKETKKEENKPAVNVHTPPRRQSVLVAAGKETKLDHPGFLSSALRRLSSSSNTTMGKGAGGGAICPRKVMNIDHNRERIKISEFDQNKLKRVAFCVDVEIAGFASQADEDPDLYSRPSMQDPQKPSLTTSDKGIGKRDYKDAKYKGKGEGAALKNPTAATEEKEEAEQPKHDTGSELPESKRDKKPQSEEVAPRSEPQPIPPTRKKEKKKRSEAERKERRERKRRHAEANGLVPLELTREDDDSDSSPSSTPPGASTPKRPSDGPTTDPLRIYKRCCQLRETTVLSRMKEQISKPSATLAEAPGTVAVMDLSGLRMQLQDVITLGDWLAVVPVRKLILDGCGLTDEAVRVILSGLASCKSAEQARQNRKLPKRLSGKSGMEQMGVIEKLSMKENPGITNLGWKYIGLFMHMSQSLRAIDLSGIPFPKSGDFSQTFSTTSSGSNNIIDPSSKFSDLGALIVHALSVRLGDKFEELILGGCGLSTANIREIVDCAIKCKIRRLGLADNNLNEEALMYVVRYIKSGVCEGLDLGGNNLHGTGHVLADAADDQCPLFAISLSDCNLTSNDLGSILIPFVKLTNLKFIDLSRNKALFTSQPNAVSVFRKLLPKLTRLKRIHLSDTEMTPEHVIALAEILPDCPSLAHLSILDNYPLVHAMNSKEEGFQEEACAFFASLMTAVRVSETIIAVEIEVPSADSSEVVKALASQVVAYSLRNMERTTLDEVGVKPTNLAEKDAPEVLLHLVGHMEGYTENHDKDEPAPDEDYVIASTGIVKALDVCLGSKDGSSRAHSRNISPAASGTTTPKQGGLRQRTMSKPRDVSLELCESARKIRMRLRPALIKEDRAGNDANYRRLIFLDQTLQRMIQRFEDEYPETKVASTSPPITNSIPSPDPSLPDPSLLSGSVDSDGLMKMTSAEEYFPADAESSKDPYALKLSRTSSNTSLAAKAYTDEEGRILRFGQTMRREVLKPTGVDDALHGTSRYDEPEPPHLAALRAKLEEVRGEDIRAKVEKDGVDNVIRELGLNAQELLMLREQDPEGFEAFRDSQLAAHFNAGLIDVDGYRKEKS
ncbi:uncharacterized protein Z518_06429 [Rhinocladiella mackenziei CBS 650.93]|uniref:Cell wall biogenesis protein Mhp1 n=1 Tax=Rhinocladiella mackenziei CBS 650.93 TaxID=1442369 RepID=A0A0D2FTZ0_9EURO|nr:uncharacterized protein Z518_06429 [Rhinocladiella mackenziei CBS 650.93]KIX05557.1 hypothetical protein Z518_06429 [Rhinocladiella mackenziei CBS 650.93]